MLALSAAALVGRRHVVVGRLEWLFFGALAALTAWTAASTAWSGDQVTPFLEAERLLLYLAVVVAVLVSVDRAQVPSLLGGVVAGVTLVSAYGLERYLTSVPVLNRVEGYLLFKPLGYANGFGIYAAIAMVLAIGLALAYPRLPVLVCAAVALGVLGTTLYYTSSRAALVAMCAGVVTIIGLRRPRLGLALAGLGVVAIAVALVVSPATSG